ncbi:rod shape-determining protein MreC [Prochlorococcus sp. MIT 1223]|uniref:rod shape-determining protein MreC n=1 Tax=Prochlorococcus sp. MIT 1223 TaxID=3096217 RepID=UPI002A75A1A5|nr:rod shape-determining protein MreC [Prochlorococcus sp. MIT 1223]
MSEFRRRNKLNLIYKKRFWKLLSILILFCFIRYSRASFFIDTYSYIVSLMWSGTSQKEWLQSSNRLEQKIKINLLEKDNQRLRKILSLKNTSDKDKVSAVVISRKYSGWWQQLELNKGNKDGILIGDSVIAPGGLIGIIHGVSQNTSRVKLLTSPGSKIGVWVDRIKQHGILVGMGTDRTKLSFLKKDADPKVGDIVSTSPASTLVPPNLVIGVIQAINNQPDDVPFAIVQLLAVPEAVDWVQIIKN